MGYVFDGNNNRLTVTTSSLENATEYKAERLSGSLTQLHDGTSYLVEGSNITITTGSNGSVTIAGTGGGGVSLSNDANNRVVTALGNGNINAEANLTFNGSLFTVVGSSRAGSGNVGRLAYIQGSFQYKNNAEANPRFIPLGNPGSDADSTLGKVGKMFHAFATPHSGQILALDMAFSGTFASGPAVPGQVDARVYISTGSVANLGRLEFPNTNPIGNHVTPANFKSTGVANKTFPSVVTDPGVVLSYDFSGDANRTFDSNRLLLIGIEPANSPGQSASDSWDITYTVTLEYNENT